MEMFIDNNFLKINEKQQALADVNHNLKVKGQIG